SRTAILTEKPPIRAQSMRINAQKSAWAAVPQPQTTLDMPRRPGLSRGRWRLVAAALGAWFASGYGRIETASGGARARACARRHEDRPRHRFDREALCRTARRTGARRT